MPVDPQSDLPPGDPSQWWQTRSLPRIIVHPNAANGPPDNSAGADGIDDWFVPGATPAGTEGPDDWFVPTGARADTSYPDDWFVPAPSAMPNTAQPAPGVQPNSPKPDISNPPAARPDPLAAYWSLIPASRAGAMAWHPPIFLPPNPFSPENIPASAWLTPPPIFLNSPGAFPLTAPTPPDDPPTAAAHGLLGGLANLQAATSNAGTEAYAPGSRPFMSPGQTEYQGAGPLYAHVRSVPLSGIDPTGSAAEGNANWSELSDARGSDDGVVLVGDKKTARRNLDVLNERAFGITPPLGSTAPRLVPPAVGGPPPSQAPLQAPPKLEFPPGIGPGPFAGEPIPAGPGKRPNTRQQDQINASGDKYKI